MPRSSLGLKKIIQLIKDAKCPSVDELQSRQKEYDAVLSEIKRVGDREALTQVLNQYCIENNRLCLFPNSELMNQIIKKLGEFKRLNWAGDLFDVLKKYKLADEYSYTNMLVTAAKGKFFGFALAVFDQAVQADRANTYTYACLIDAAGKKGDLAHVKRAYDLALASGQVDAAVHVTLIDIADKLKDFKLATYAYENALKFNQCNARLYARMIYAAGMAKCILAVKKVFQKAREAGHVNSFAINNLIYVAGLNDDLKLAQEAYAFAKAKGLINPVLQHAYINVLVYAQQLDEAKKIWHQSSLRFQTYPVNEGAVCIDLHGHTYGSALICLQELIERSSSRQEKFVLMIDQGNVSSSMAPVMQAAIRCLQQYNVKFKVDAEHSGQIKFELNSKLSSKVALKGARAANSFFQETEGRQADFAAAGQHIKR